MMSIRDLFYEVFSSLSANKMRSALTILGIVIGISSVILMLALVSGYEKVIFSEMGGEQSRLLTTWASGADKSAYDRMSQRVRGVERVETMAYAWSGEPPTIDGKTAEGQGQMAGVSQGYAEVRGLVMEAGRWFSASEARGAQRVVVIGKGLADAYGIPPEQIIGKNMTISNSTYRIVGVIQASRMSMEGMSTYMPLETAQSWITGTTLIDTAFIKVAENHEIDSVKDQVKTYLANAMGIDADGVSIESMDALIAQIKTAIGVLQAILGSIAGISLLVGGIGIMNMMLTNVTERIREIGLRKALGANSRTITNQFLTESIVLTVSGGLLGIFFGFLLSQVGGVIIRAVVPDVGAFSPVITLWSVALSVSVSMIIGIVFGWYPARRAAKLDPIEALRFQ